MSLPEEFIKEIESYDSEYLAGLVDALSSTDPEISVRVNPHKGVSVPDNVEKVAWCGQGFYLNERPQFTFDPALHQGLYYVQDASSMAISHAVNHIISTEERRPMRYLDVASSRPKYRPD